MKQPDRFEMMVKKGLIELQGNKIGLIRPNDVVKLLRREHQAVVRKVKATAEYVAKKDRSRSFDFQSGYATACEDLLAWLEARGK